MVSQTFAHLRSLGGAHLVSNSNTKHFSKIVYDNNASYFKLATRIAIVLIQVNYRQKESIYIYFDV